MGALKVPVGDADHVAVRGEAAPGETICELVEYGDYQCPHCAMAFPVVKRLERHFKGRLRFVFRNFPLTKIHANAQVAAEAAEWAGSCGKFWEMHDALFHKQKEWENLETAYEYFVKLAGDLGLEPGQCAEAIEAGRFAERVRADFLGGVRSGVNGTPTFFINGERHNGPNDYDHLLEKIEAELQA
jgi:protein-disulfide isomerase